MPKQSYQSSAATSSRASAFNFRWDFGVIIMLLVLLVHQGHQFRQAMGYLSQSSHVGAVPVNYSGNTTNTKVEKPPMLSEGRMLFGIFTYDSPNEREMRQANRETHLIYYQQHLDVDLTRRAAGASRQGQQSNTTTTTGNNKNTRNTVCTLQEFMMMMMNHADDLVKNDRHACRFIYTFVMGGGIGDPKMRNKATSLEHGRSTTFTTNSSRTGADGQPTHKKPRCLWGDPECCGTDMDCWTLSEPKCNISNALVEEMEQYDDITFLSIPENHEMGKTDTWFTYLAMLTQKHNPEWNIGFVGKLDSDVLVHFPSLFQHTEQQEAVLVAHPYVYAGYAITKQVCSGPAYGRVCADPNFIAPLFVTGAMAYLTTPLAQHVFLDGTSLARKQQVWIVGEDLQLANMVFSDNSSSSTVHTIVHQTTRGTGKINFHYKNNPAHYRQDYYRRYFATTEEEFQNHVQAYALRVPRDHQLNSI